MSVVKAQIEIAAPQEKVFGTALDPETLDRWVTIHRKLNDSDSGGMRAGFEMTQTLCVRGANFKVRWRLTEYDPPNVATWEGRGPARSYARTTYRLRPDGDGRTRFDYENEFKAPGGVLGAAASRALMGGVPEREARRSLERLKALLEG